MCPTNVTTFILYTCHIFTFFVIWNCTHKMQSLHIFEYIFHTLFAYSLVYQITLYISVNTVYNQVLLGKMYKLNNLPVWFKSNQFSLVQLKLWIISCEDMAFLYGSANVSQSHCNFSNSYKQEKAQNTGCGKRMATGNKLLDFKIVMKHISFKKHYGDKWVWYQQRFIRLVFITCCC